jgi:hypothetical protein
MVFVTFLFTGCEKSVQKSPSEVVKEAYMLANEGEYSETEKYFTSELLEHMKSDEWIERGGLKGAWDRFTKDRTIERIEIQDESISGDSAIVKFRLYFKDGSTKDEDEPLKKEMDAWKITIG